MTFEEVLPALREGKKIRRTDKCWQDIFGYVFYNNEKMGLLYSEPNAKEYFRYDFDETDLFSTDWEIVKETILNNKESEYLKIVCALFKERVISITRFKVTEDDCFIQINLKNPAFIISLPFKSEANYFTGMEQGKPYTLKDLDISYN